MLESIVEVKNGLVSWLEEILQLIDFKKNEIVEQGADVESLGTQNLNVLTNSALELALNVGLEHSNKVWYSVASIFDYGVLRDLLRLLVFL